MASSNKKRVEHRHDTLTVQDRFYIENNGNMSVEELAEVLKQPVNTVQEYCDEWLKKHPQEVKKPAKELMNRPAKGVTAMTGAASEVGDDSHKKYVTVEAINRAMAAGQHDVARELQKRYDEQQKKQSDIIRNKYKDMIHYIIPPDDNEDI